MARYNTIMPNDVVNGRGVCVSFWVQGCARHCPKCFNESTWDFKGGTEYTDHTKWEVIEAISANGIQRNFSVLGGEPLDPHNINMVNEVVSAVRHAYPDVEIILWTSFELEELLMDYNKTMESILDNINYVVTGPYVDEQRDLSLFWRGSRNQHIYTKKNDKWVLAEDEIDGN